MPIVRILIISAASIALAGGQFDSTVARNAFAPDNPPQRVEPVVRSALSPEQQGDIFMARKMFREAIDSYRKGPQNSAVIWNKIGIAYHQLGDFATAKKNYERAMKLDGKYADAINNDGTIFYAQKRYRTAISRYRKAIGMAPDTASFWSNLGTAWYSRGRFEEMATAYQRALTLDPQVFEHHGTVGTELQDRTVADRARYHYELARIYAHAGKNELALQYLRKSLEEGLKDKAKMTEAPEFADLRETTEFKELLTLEPRVL
ncbi:MAG: tetratricopeptide repeat protein [Acidobacteriota bacterium]|nr:tetratricopeptide repeat protein [Acidobacteriota bacterium]